MSLDLHVNRRVPKKDVYVKDGGYIRKIDTIQEIKDTFGDRWMEVTDEENVWWKNITHNLTKMADNVPAGSHSLYRLLWHPEEILKDGLITDDYKRSISAGLRYLESHRELDRFNPPNGWGSYSNLLSFVMELNTFLYLDDSEYYIHASV